MHLDNAHDGYAVQQCLNQRLQCIRSSRLAGYKIGCTTPVMQTFLGIDHPCGGGILEQDVLQSGALLQNERYVQVGFEGEIAVRVGQDLALRETPYAGTAMDIGQAISHCMVAIEVVDNRYSNFKQLSVATLIADDFFQSGAVLGTPVSLNAASGAGTSAVPLAQLSGRLFIDDEEVECGTGDAVMGDPLNALAWLANLLAQQGRPLRSGQLVLLGSLVQTRWLQGKHDIRFEVDQLGAVEVHLA